MKHSFIFKCIDDSGKHQVFTVKAIDKMSAIDIGYKRAKRNARGDIISWECILSH